jgi:hypothetical protein
MVYSILVLPGNRFFIGCKSEKETLNIFDEDFNLIKTRNDNSSKGIYEVDFYKNRIIFATRTGMLKSVDSNNLGEINSIKLTQEGTRLWSVKIDKKKKLIYTGDYDGNLYVLDLNFELKKKLNLNKFYKKDKKLDEGFGPSLWGIEIYKDKLLLAHRWGEILVVDRDLKLEKRIKFNQDISNINFLNKNILLVGTRRGDLFTYDFRTDKKSKIISIKPSLQKENSIWGIDQGKKELLVSFADGNLIKVCKT